jgi:hypothetical protein
MTEWVLYLLNAKYLTCADLFFFSFCVLSLLLRTWPWPSLLCLKSLHEQTMRFLTERRGRVVGTTTLFSGSPGLKSWHGDQPFWLMIFAVFLSPSIEMPGWYLKLGQRASFYAPFESLYCAVLALLVGCTDYTAQLFTLFYCRLYSSVLQSYLTVDSDPLMSCLRAVFRCPLASKAGCCLLAWLFFDSVSSTLWLTSPKSLS